MRSLRGISEIDLEIIPGFCMEYYMMNAVAIDIYEQLKVHAWGPMSWGMYIRGLGS